MNNPRKKTPEERAADHQPRWRVVHTFSIGGSDVRKLRIVQQLGHGRSGFALELGIPSRVGEELAWLPFEEKVFQDCIVRLIHRDVVMELGSMAATRLEYMEHALAVARTDELLASLVKGEAIEVQLAGSDSDWVPAKFVGLEDGWVRVKFTPLMMVEHGITDDPNETLIMRGHVQRPQKAEAS